ncbi:MAG TPA: WYL domain-containing protein [Anaerovoracaceae bacterium]|nr:WYL domain-containing protein [Anaerovoracaceae bacterium]
MNKVDLSLREQFGIKGGVGKRTIQNDIEMMRSNRLGYNAPIIVKDRKYYTYSDPKFTITNSPLSKNDISKLKEVVMLLKEFNSFGHFEHMTEMITKLENNIYKCGNQSSCIQFESNSQLQGLEHLTGLYEATMQKAPLIVSYQSFKAEQPQQLTCLPHLLKEYRNRWFLIVREKNSGSLMTLALDRIKSFVLDPSKQFIEHEQIDFDEYFKDLIGVTRSEKSKAEKVRLFVAKATAPYVLTKPLHHSQRITKQDTTGIIIELCVIRNFELEREILGFGKDVRVLSPATLKKAIMTKLQESIENYE